MSKYTGNKKNTKKKGGLVHCVRLEAKFTAFTKQLSFTVRFSGLPRIKPLPVYTTLSCPTLTHARTRDADFLLAFRSRETTCTWRSCCGKLLTLSTEVPGTTKPHNEALRLQIRGVSSPLMQTSLCVGLFTSSFVLNQRAPCRLLHSSGVVNNCRWLEPRRRLRFTVSTLQRQQQHEDPTKGHPLEYLKYKCRKTCLLLFL